MRHVDSKDIGLTVRLWQLRRRSQASLVFVGTLDEEGFLRFGPFRLTAIRLFTVRWYQLPSSLRRNSAP